LVVDDRPVAIELRGVGRTYLVADGRIVDRRRRGG
jgi:hypothetical protein